MKRIIFSLSFLFLLFGLLGSGLCSSALRPEENGLIGPGKLEKEVKAGPQPTVQEIPKVDPDLDLATQEPLPIIVYLKDQPRHDISQQIRPWHQPQIDRLTDEIDEINRRYAIETPSAVDPTPSPLAPSDIAAINRLNREIKELIIEMRGEITAEMERRTGPEQEDLRGYIESLGGRPTYGYTLVNAVAARVPGVRIGELANHRSVGYIVEDKLLETHLNTSTYSIRANTWWNQGYDGGWWWGGVLDTGIDTLHPSLTWHTFRSRVFHAMGQGNPNYNDNPGTTDDLQGHGTHVGGIVWSRGNWEWPWDWTGYKGVAYGADYCINGKAGWRTTTGRGAMYWSDGMAAADWAINTVWADALNLSYGGSTLSDETGMSRFFDAVVEDEDVPCAISAGNDGPGSYTLNDPGVSYNAFCVGAMDDQNSSGRGDDGVASYSSRGPTRGKDRKKPDIMTPGSSIASCAHNWEGWPFNPDFVSMSGTSMAAPHLMGAVLLYKDWGGFKNAKIIKAVFLNTCEDWGSAGWNNDSGWGYLDLDHAWFHRSDYFTSSVNPSGQPGDYKLYRGTMYDKDKATLVWHRHARYRGASYPTTYYDLNDLDLRLYSHTDGSLLDISWEVWDNVEQVRATATHSVVAKVEAYSSSFQGVTSEPYALATEEGFWAVSPPSLSVTVSNPAEVVSYEQFTVSVPVRNNGGCTAFNTWVNLTLPPGFVIIAGVNPQSVGHIGAGSTSTATWIVRAPWTAGSYTLAANAWSYSYGEQYTGSDTSPIEVVSGLDIIEVSLAEDYRPTSPWCQPGLIELTFHVRAVQEDLTHITFSSDDLHHLGLDKKLAGYEVNFVPQEIGFLQAGDIEEVTAYVQIPIGQHEGSYRGYFRAVCCQGYSDEVFVEIFIYPLRDLDIEDNRANLSANTMELVGIPNSVVLGSYNLVNPNMMDNNVDLFDGPGNADLDSVLTYESTDLVNKDGSASIPASCVYPDVVGIDFLASGHAAQNVAMVIIHWDTPSDTYRGTVTVTDMVGVSDEFTLEVTVDPEGLLLAGFWGRPDEKANGLYWTGFDLGEEGYNLYRSEDGAVSFHRLNESLLSGTSYPDKDVFAGQTYRYKLGVSLGNEVELLLGPIPVTALGRSPDLTALLQSYPNPFNQQTSIRYQLAAPAHTSLRVFDVTGQMVRSLLDEQKVPGYYTVSWNGRDSSGREVAAGVYFYRLTAGDFSATRKVVVLK